MQLIFNADCILNRILVRKKLKDQTLPLKIWSGLPQLIIFPPRKTCFLNYIAVVAAICSISRSYGNTSIHTSLALVW